MFLHLFPQPFDVYVHRPGIAEIVKAPHLVQQLVAGVDPVGRGANGTAAPAPWRRVHLLPVHDQLVGVQVDDELVEGQLLGVSLGISVRRKPR